METETWIEWTIVDQLTIHDRRYKHDYGGVEKTTDELVVDCTKLDAITAESGPKLPSIEQLLTAEANLEPEVETTLQTLQEHDLIERVGERDRLGPPLEMDDYGTTTV
jgi:capsule polysaccharide export protein KpsE/RkpR